MSADEGERTRPQLELMIDGVFAPARFLDLVRDFVFFETDGARTWKVLAKYHQVDAVHTAAESVSQAMGGDKRGGIVWHTQGAGKSYTMVFFVNKLRRDARFGNPTIVAVKDLRRVEDVLETEEQDAANKLVTTWAKLEKVVGAEDRLQRLAEGVAQHYRERCEALEGKAMVVAYSRRIAAELTGLLQQRLGPDAVDCVISAHATDPPAISRFRRSKPELKELAKRFKDRSDPLRVVVVKDMWLTGFDAPVLHTLYVDKPMRDHGLLQAIARVNRVFRDKPGGLVVDYIGIGEDLRASLQAYDEMDIDEPVIPAARAVAGLWEKYEVICALLHPIGFRPGELQRTPNPEKLFWDAYNLILETDERTRDFLAPLGG